MRKSSLTLLFILASLLLGYAIPVMAQDPSIPRITKGDRGWVDTTGTVPNETMEALRDQSDRIGLLNFQLAGVFFSNINGSLVEFATKVGNENGIGSAEKDNGLLVVVLLDRASSSDGHKPSIFVATGRGIEGLLPDTRVANFLSQYFYPKRVEDKWQEGLITLTTKFGDFLADPKADEFRSNPESSTASESNVFILIILAFVFILVVIVIIHILMKKPSSPQNYNYVSNYPPYPKPGVDLDELIDEEEDKRTAPQPRTPIYGGLPPADPSPSTHRSRRRREEDSGSSSLGFGVGYGVGSTYGGSSDSGSSYGSSGSSYDSGSSSSYSGSDSGSSLGGGGSFGGGGSGDN